MTDEQRACKKHTWKYIGILSKGTRGLESKNKYIYPSRFCSKCGLEQFYTGDFGWADTGNGAGMASLAFYGRQELTKEVKWRAR